jgi:hypothetical protein
LDIIEKQLLVAEYFGISPHSIIVSHPWPTNIDVVDSVIMIANNQCLHCIKTFPGMIISGCGKGAY